jgi:hypothetical protein
VMFLVDVFWVVTLCGVVVGGSMDLWNVGMLPQLRRPRLFPLPWLCPASLWVTSSFLSSEYWRLFIQALNGRNVMLTSPPSVLMAWSLIQHRDKFIIYIIN